MKQNFITNRRKTWLRGVCLLCFLSISTLAAVSQTRVSGSVFDAAGEPVIGANIVEKGVPANGTITDADGRFTLAVKPNATLTVSYIGFVTKNVAVSGQGELRITLSEDAEALEEVVVTALGMKRSEKALAYATQKVDGEALNKVKGANLTTSLTGRVAGLQINNSTEFLEDPSINLRGGGGALLVIDGVPYGNINLRDINQDDIQDINVLKGSTASALYGSRGGNGAIMITTKKGGNKGFTLDVNTSNMFYAGELTMPENQTSYSSGEDGKYNHNDYVWGDKLDIGRIYEQWDPINKEWRWMELTSKGKNNFKDFLQFSMVSNTSVSVSQRGENGGIRSSLSYLYNKGQYPNQKYQRFNYTLSGDVKLGDKVTVESSINFNKRMSPNVVGGGANAQGYIYNILMWTGPEYRLADYKDYWVIPHEKQSWHYNNYYDNPWFSANECFQTLDENKFNGMLSVNYQILPSLKIMARSGLDLYGKREVKRNPIGVNGSRMWVKAVGGYSEAYWTNWSMNNDLIATFDKRFGKFSVNAIAGGTIFFYENAYLRNSTKGGLAVPGFYSISNSKDAITPDVGYTRKQLNSVYGNLSLGYNNAFFVDVSGRNDWSSTLPTDQMSYFYPSAGGSIVLSELLPLPDVMKFWKLRGSWTVSKSDLGVYDINTTYGITLGAWDNFNSANYPESIRGSVNPITNRTYELGTSLYLFEGNRLKLDFAYFNRLRYDDTRQVNISSYSGFKRMLVNTNEQTVYKGVELTVDAVPVKTGDFKWNIIANWSKYGSYYAQLDETFSSKAPWVKVGNRTDFLTSDYDYQRDPQGNIVHDGGGLPIINNTSVLMGYGNPDWIWGLNNSFTYKHWTLNVSLDGRVGGTALNFLERYSWANGSNPESDTQWRYDEVVNGKKNYIGEGVRVVSGSVKYDSYGQIIEDTRTFEPNTTEVGYQAYIKRWASRNTRPFWQQSTFFKIRELSLSYDIPFLYAKKIGANKASVALVGQNLLLWVKEYKYSDPDKGLGGDDLAAPAVRYIGVNLNLTF